MLKKIKKEGRGREKEKTVVGRWEGRRERLTKSLKPNCPWWGDASGVRGRERGKARDGREKPPRRGTPSPGNLSISNVTLLARLAGVAYLQPSA